MVEPGMLEMYSTSEESLKKLKKCGLTFAQLCLSQDLYD